MWTWKQLSPPTTLFSCVECTVLCTPSVIYCAAPCWSSICTADAGTTSWFQQMFGHTVNKKNNAIICKKKKKKMSTNHFTKCSLARVVIFFVQSCVLFFTQSINFFGIYMIKKMYSFVMYSCGHTAYPDIPGFLLGSDQLKFFISEQPNKSLCIIHIYKINTCILLNYVLCRN